MSILPGMSPRRSRILWLALSVAASAGACAPLLRLGEIEPPEGTRTLVDLEVRPRPRAGLSQDELAAVVSDTSVGLLVTTQLPGVASSDAGDEMAANVQGMSVPASDALVDEAQLATDARRLESIYMARGYFRAKNLGHKIIVRGEDRAVVTFSILEGSETTVSEIRLLGTCEIEEDPDAEKLKRLRELCSDARDMIPMRVGDTWTEAAYATGLDVLIRAFRGAGFIHARVIGDNWVSRDRGVAAVWYQIDSGPLVRVTGEVIIEGNVHVGLDRIRRRIDISEGDVLDDELLRSTERNIQELGPFFSVQAVVVREDAPDAPPAAPEAPLATPTEPALAPEPEPAPTPAPETAPETAPAPETTPAPETAPEMGPMETERPAVLRPELMKVKVQVAEAPRWELTIGPSVVTDFQRLDLALPIAFTHRNLFGEVVALVAQARPALVLPNCFSGTACFDEPDLGLDAKLGLQVPSFFEEYLRFAIDATYKRDPTQEAKSQEIGGSVGLSRRLFPGLTARIGYNVAFFNYFGSSTLAALTPEDEVILIRDAALRFEKQDFLAWFDASLVLDQRDSPLDTRDGFFASVALNLAGAYAGSDVPYTRLLGDVRGYWTPMFLEWLTLAARVKVGANFFDPSLGTPAPARFKSGGATSMRGFETDRIGDFVCAKPEPAPLRRYFGPDVPPRKYLNNQKCGTASTDRTYIGGNYIIESNFELRFRFRGGLGLVAFMDVGRVWSVGGPRFDDIHVAIGPGVRYETPVGPARLDVAFLLGRDRTSEIHVTLGQAF